MSDQASAATGGSASAFRAAMTGGGLNTPAPAPQAPAAVPNVPAAPVANDNGRGQQVAPGDDPSVVQQLLADDDEGIPGLEEAAEAAEPDDSTPPPDPLEEVVHTDDKGAQLKMRDLVESLKKGVVPEALHEKLQFEMTVNGSRMVLSAKELGSGYMRHADYTKKTQAVQETRRENEAFQKSFDGACERAAKDPSGAELRKMMRRMGLGQALENAAASIAIEYANMEKMTPGEREAHQRARMLEEQMETLREQALMNQENERDKKRRQHQEAFQREYGNLTPTALTRAGLKGTPTERKAYNAALKVLLDEPGARLTLDLCTQAAFSARDELADQAVQYRTEVEAATPAQRQLAAQQQQRGAPQPQQGLPVRRVAPAPVTGAAGISGNTGGTPGQFRKFLAGRSSR